MLAKIVFLAVLSLARIKKPPLLHSGGSHPLKGKVY